MKTFHRQKLFKKSPAAFSLVEVVVALGLFTFGFISLIPILALGLNSTRQSRDEQLTAQIAQTLIENARQGMPVSGVAYFDFQGGACSSSQAAYRVQTSLLSLQSGPLRQLTLRIIPCGQPDHARTYAVILPPSS